MRRAKSIGQRAEGIGKRAERKQKIVCSRQYAGESQITENEKGQEHGAIGRRGLAIDDCISPQRAQRTQRFDV